MPATGQQAGEGEHEMTAGRQWGALEEVDRTERLVGIISDSLCADRVYGQLVMQALEDQGLTIVPAQMLDEARAHGAAALSAALDTEARALRVASA